MKWLFITAGVGDYNFELAAQRLAVQVADLNVFEKIKIFTNEDVYQYCPEIFNWYSKKELFQTKGFGWYVWKSRFGRLASEGEFGNFDGVMYLDAGCEVFNSYFSKKRIYQYLKKAEETGVCLFKSATPEIEFTKQLVLDRFSVYNLKTDKFQFQSGSWFVSGDKGRDLLKLWDEIIWENRDFTNEKPTLTGESKSFVGNRWDQGVFSMAVRKFGLDSLESMPPGDISRFKSKIKLFFYPFAWARNRTGQTLIPGYMAKLGKISLKLEIFTNFLNRNKTLK